MSATTTNAPALEPAAQAFAEATANRRICSSCTRRGPQGGRRGAVRRDRKPEVDEEWVSVAGGPTGRCGCGSSGRRAPTGTLPVILYIHGAGWVFGNAHTHDRLVRELAVGAGAAVVFPEYDRSPEARYPVALEQSYAVAQWVCARAPPRASTRPASPSPATRWAATWRPP